MRPSAPMRSLVCSKSAGGKGFIVMEWLYQDENEKEFVQEVSTLPDRLVGLLAPILLEDRLQLAIQHRWVDNPIKRGTTIFADLFGSSGELGSFGTKIRVGFAVGLYGSESYSDLVHIEKIRNTFAHRFNIRSFDEQPIIDRVRKLTINDRWPEGTPTPITLGSHAIFIVPPEDDPVAGTPRAKFLRAVQVFSNLLYTEARVRRKDPRIPEF